MLVTKNNMYTAEIRVALYVRVSTLNQSQIESVEDQIQYMKSLVSQHSNWKLGKEHIYIDRGKTGTSTYHRDEFNKMIEDAEHDKFDLIVCRDISRFARNTEDYLRFTRVLCEDYDVAVYSMENNTLSSDSESRMFSQMLAMLYENESNLKREMFKNSWKYREGLEWVMGSNNLYGYELIKTARGESNRRVIIEEEAEVIRRIFDMCINGIGIRTITQILIDEGIPRRKIIDKKTGLYKFPNWGTSTVEYILTNPTYYGCVVFNGSRTKKARKKVKNLKEERVIIEVGKEKVEPIITKEIYDKAQISLHARKTYYGNSGRKVPERKQSTIYSMKLRCSCGSTFKHHHVGHPNQKSARMEQFVCYKHERSKINNCKQQPFNKVVLDLMARRIFEGISKITKEDVEILVNTIYEIHYMNKDSLLSKYEKLKNKKGELISKKKVFMDNFVNSYITEDEYKEQISSISKQINDLSLEITSLSNKLNGSKTEDDVIKEILKKIPKEKSLMQKNELGYDEVVKEIINQYILRIDVEGNTFKWYVDPTGNASSPVVQNHYMETQPNDIDVFSLIDSFNIEYEDAAKICEETGHHKFYKARWSDKTCEVYFVNRIL